MWSYHSPQVSYKGGWSTTPLTTTRGSQLFIGANGVARGCWVLAPLPIRNYSRQML